MTADGAPPPDEPPPFWQVKTLEEMTDPEWESLCDGCGRCCLNKLEDEETNELIFTSIACNLLDCTSCRCSDYENRSVHVPDCVKLTPEQVRTLDWLPPSCAYVRVRDGRGLAWWHPLVSGDPDTVHAAGISVRGRVSAKERDLDLDDFELHAVTWPGEG